MVSCPSRISPLVAASLSLFVGCTAMPERPARSVVVTSPQPKFELLGFPDCPNTPAMRANLRAALTSIGKGWVFTDTDQGKLPEGDLRRGYASPTVLMNDRDLYGLPVPTMPGMGCRIYPDGVPDASDIAWKIKFNSVH